MAKSHAQQLEARVRARRPGDREAARFYRSKSWRRLRLWMLQTHPICQDCKRQPASEVHHVQERKRRPDLQLDQDNLECLCKACHSRKTARTSLGR